MNTYQLIKNPTYKKGDSNGYTILANGNPIQGFQSYQAARLRIKELNAQHQNTQQDAQQ